MTGKYTISKTQGPKYRVVVSDVQTTNDSTILYIDIYDLIKKRVKTKTKIINKPITKIDEDEVKKILETVLIEYKVEQKILGIEVSE